MEKTAPANSRKASISEKLLYALFITLFIFLFASASSFAQTTTLYVSKTGSDTTGDGTSAKPWLTMQHAINAAVSGSIISVAAGTYSENIIITTANITLLGDPGATGKAGPGSSAPVIAGQDISPGMYGAVTIEAAGVTISGFDISSPYGFYAVAVGDPTGGGTGSAPDDVAISYNHLHDVNGTSSGDGIRVITVEPSSGVDIKYNIVENGTPTNSGVGSYTNTIAGIFIRSAGGAFSNTTIEDNIVRNITQDNATGNRSAIGIWVGGSGGSATVSNLKVVGNQISGIESNLSARGFMINHAYNGTGTTTGLDIENNTVSNLTGTTMVRGIALEATTPSATVSNNTISSLTDSDSPANPDVTGIAFVANPTASTVTLSGNKFNGDPMSNAKFDIPVNGSWSSLSTSGNTYPEVLFNGKYYYYGINAYSTIQSGVDSASAAGTINVAAGTYSEAVSISKSLTLHGAQHGVDARSRSGLESIIDGGTSTAVNIQASDVTADGFTIESSTATASSVIPAVKIGTFNSPPYPASDTVANSIIQNSPRAAIAWADSITFIQDLVQGNSGDGIFIAYGSRPTIKNCSFKNGQLGGSYTSGGDIVISPLPGRCTSPVIQGDSSISTSNLVALFLSDSAMIRDNYVQSESGSGLYIGGADSVVTITNNTIKNGSSSAIYLDGHPKTNGSTQNGPNYKVTITHNTLTGNSSYGLDIYSHIGDQPGLGASDTAAFQFNAVTGNTSGGVNNPTSGHVAATGNYWGDVNGPKNATTNPSAGGNPVSDNVTYSPWWTENYVGNNHSSPWTWGANSDIGDAISTVSSGDIINVAAGTYNENLSISKSLTLLGAQHNVDPRLSQGGRIGPETIIDGSGGTSTVTVSDSNVTINGFTIKKGQTQAISGGSSNLSILYNKFSENGWNSNYCYVYNVRGVSTTLFQYNDVVADTSRSHGVNYGFYAWGNSDGNEIRDNDFRGAFGNAIYIKGYDNHVSINNEITANDITAANAAMQLESISSTTVTNNRLYTNTYGLYLWGRYGGDFADISITNNTISGNTRGVYIKPGTYGDLTNFHINTNSITSNTEYGISNATGIVVDASKNYWGDAAGPKNATTNPSAGGNSVSDNVTYSPWWTENYVGNNHSSPWTWGANGGIDNAINTLSGGDTLYVTGTYSGGINASKNVIVKFATPPVINSLVVNSDSLSLSSDVTVSSSIDLAKGNVVTGRDNKIILGTSASDPTESSGGRIIGTVEVTPRDVGVGSLQLLGLHIQAGDADLGNVGFTRMTGSAGIVTAGGNSGIATTWQISVDHEPTSGRTVTFSWLRDFDNGVDTNNVTVYRNEGTGWQAYAGPFSVSGNPRQITVNVTGFSDWTMGPSGDQSLPVQATSFAAKADYDRVTLTWKTQSEINNAGFNILREDSGTTSPQSVSSTFKLIASCMNNSSLKGLGTSTSGRDYSFTDSKVQSGSTYLYKIQSVSTSGTTRDLTTLSVTVDVPRNYALYQNYPNPFNPSTTIRFDLKQTSTVTLDIYNVLGQRVLEENYGTMNAGRHNENINLASYASGVYYYRIDVTGNSGERFTSVKKLMVMK